MYYFRKRYFCLSPYVGLFLILNSVFSYAAYANKNDTAQITLHPERLGWITSPASAGHCAGYFKQIPLQKKAPLNRVTEITALGKSTLSKISPLILTGGVRIEQKDLRILAEKARIFHEKNTTRPTIIELIGPVEFQTRSLLLIANNATLNLPKNRLVLTSVLYRVIKPEDKKNSTLARWGTAQSAVYEKDHQILTLYHAKYSRCAPINPIWHVKAKRLSLNLKKNQLYAQHAQLKIHNIPIFFIPTLSFSLEKKRQSGFLSPSFQNSSNNGLTLTLPYYWNIDPNQDLTITPLYREKRGGALSALWRYLFDCGKIEGYTQYLPYDKAFETFKKNILSHFGPNPLFPYTPYINELSNQNNQRAYFSLESNFQFPNNLSLSTQIHYVTDPYFFNDLGEIAPTGNNTQLLNQITVRYQTNHWNMVLLSQAYETLHLIQQVESPAVAQYTRLPEIDLSGSYPNFYKKIHLFLSLQAVNFLYHSAFAPITETKPQGQRYHLRNSFYLPLEFSAGYINPRLILDQLFYNTERKANLQKQQDSRTLPLFNIDSGLYFNREFTLGKHLYTQLVTPRIFYLFVPFTQQTQQPVYDSEALPFSYNQLFTLNRFTSFDRIQNANQVSLGIESTWYDSNAERTRLSTKMGIGYRFSTPKVSLNDTPLNKSETEHWTPLAANLLYSPATHWNLTENIAWDIQHGQINNSTLEVQYLPDDRHIFGAGLTYIQPEFGTTSAEKTLLYHTHISWPVNPQWQGLGYMSYDNQLHKIDRYFVGVQYETCCLALRFLFDKKYTGESLKNIQPSVSNYDSRYILQVQFKGLGTAGNTNPRALLESTIPGYSDPFA